jgi:hypothetical protein
MMNKSAALRAPSAKSRKSNGKITPPHSLSGGAVDENHRCKRQYPKELQQPHPPLNRLSGGAVDTGAMSHTPSHVGQRANGWKVSMQMLVFKGVMKVQPLANQLANGPPART